MWSAVHDGSAWTSRENLVPDQRAQTEEAPVAVTTRSEAAIAAVTSQLTRSNDPASVLADIVSYAVSCLGLVCAAIVARSADGELHSLCSAPAERPTGVWADLHTSAPVAEGVRQGTVIVVDDILDDGHRWNEERELLSSVGVRGVRVYPVRVHGAAVRSPRRVHRRSLGSTTSQRYRPDPGGPCLPRPLAGIRRAPSGDGGRPDSRPPRVPGRCQSGLRNARRGRQNEHRSRGDGAGEIRTVPPCLPGRGGSLADRRHDQDPGRARDPDQGRDRAPVVR